jgi:dTDP-4-dehydrorhamnose 3,5-epimerase-like enzyme
MIPTLISGKSHSDDRGRLTFNNSFDASAVKRIYTIENKDIDFVRGWQGHKIEQRWFSAVKGSFKIEILEIQGIENSDSEIIPLTFVLHDKNLDVLHVPAGFVTSIQALESDAKLILMSDYMLGEIHDEIRYPLDFRKNN